MASKHIGTHTQTHWVGLDVSKDTFDAAWLSCAEPAPSKNLAYFPWRAFPRNTAGVEMFLQWIDEQLEREVDDGAAPRCVMEATGRYSTELALWLLSYRESLSPAIAQPRRTSHFIESLGVRNVTDSLAARGLAVYGREREPDAYVPPSVAELELREVCRFRDSLVRQRTALKNQLHDKSASAFVEDEREELLSSFNGRIERVEKEMRRIVREDPDLKHTVATMMTINGVGFLTAAVIRCELGDLRRFERARQLSAFAGMNPCVRQSGTSVHGRTRLSKQGNSRSRQALYMAGMAAVRGDTDLARTYHRLIANGKEKMAALGVVMRKLLLLMRAVLIHDTPYDPEWTTRGKGPERAT